MLRPRAEQPNEHGSSKTIDRPKCSEKQRGGTETSIVLLAEHLASEEAQSLTLRADDAYLSGRT